MIRRCKHQSLSRYFGSSLCVDVCNIIKRTSTQWLSLTKLFHLSHAKGSHFSLKIIITKKKVFSCTNFSKIFVILSRCIEKIRFLWYFVNKYIRRLYFVKMVSSSKLNITKPKFAGYCTRSPVWRFKIGLYLINTIITWLWDL